MGGEQIIIHNNAHSVIWKEPGGCMFAIRLVLNCGTSLTLYANLYSRIQYVVCLHMHCTMTSRDS